MKILHIVLTVIFVLFAAVQYNDADPWLWIPIYLYAAVLCFMGFRNNYPKRLLLLSILVYFLGSIYYFPGVYELFTEHEAQELANKMKADKPYIEEARESLGLLICVLAMVHLYFRGKKQARR